MRVKDVGRFLPVEKLLEGGPYLLTGAPIPLHTRPGDLAPLRVPVTRTEVNLRVNVRAFKRVAGVLWVQVESLSVNPCNEEEKVPAGPISGWLPFHDAKGQPSVWFSPRGC
ncbi:MAG: hypothetical protein EXR70_22705 [Deltaproteobacteria bacterium]|nr:hypothetical protein [Deltaproteobacteria bacterium]